MSLDSRWRRGALVAGTVIPVAVALTAGPGMAGNYRGPGGLLPDNPRGHVALNAEDGDSGGGGGETQKILARAQEYAAVRTAPAASVSSEAFSAAYRQARALKQSGRSWQEVTNLPYRNDARNYRDPFWSNSSAGWREVTGRITGLATDGPRTVYAAAAGGGVWKSTDKGAHWKPIFDQQEKLSIGAVAVDPSDHSVWVGTGEANTNADAFNGAGIYRSGDGGKSFQLVGNRLNQYLVYRLTFDGRGHVYAATSRGLIKHRTLGLIGNWRTLLKPDPNPTHSPYRTSFITDVKVRPGTGGRVVLAALGWRGGTLPEDTQYNGFYLSTDSGAHFSRLTLRGDLAGATDVGRTTFSWSNDGSKLYAVVESSETVTLKAAYRSSNGDPAGPWTLIADEETLVKAGSALAKSGGDPGSQAWYNQDIKVDPRDSSHVYLDLEEVFETSNSGAKWSTIGPYWNFPLDCWDFDPTKNVCPPTTHPDQHAIAISADGTGYFGNDGGVYSRATNLRNVVRWNNLNVTMDTLQYYDAGIGKVAGGDAIWGGLQDNGVSLLLPGKNSMVSPFGGDGGDVIVDPNNGNKSVQEYVFLNMASTTNGGRSDSSTRSFRTISPSCFNVEFTPAPCDPNPRFIAPFEADQKNINHWVAGGQYIWDNQGRGWATDCSTTTCTWKKTHDLGDGAQTTALGVNRHVTYAGWCGNGCNPGRESVGLPFVSGIDTNYGGRWHRVSAPKLPNRMPTDFYVDPANAAHVYVTYGAFSRRWIPGGGVGHVFESTNGGGTWRDVSGNLPDAPTNAVAMWHGKLVVGTDVGVFVRQGSGTWARLGGGLPNTQTLDLVVSPNRSYLLAATHGRGMWKIAG